MATNIIVNPTELETVSGQIDAKNTSLKEKLEEFAKSLMKSAKHGIARQADVHLMQLIP